MVESVTWTSDCLKLCIRIKPFPVTSIGTTSGGNLWERASVLCSGNGSFRSGG